MTNSARWRANGHRVWPQIVFALCLYAGWSPGAWAQAKQDILFFTSVDAFKVLSESVPVIDDEFLRPTLDMLYSYSDDRFRVLVEYNLSSDESELERLKAGWKLADNTMLWFGRFHATSKNWTTEYHHGQFLQNPITQPSVEQWEDESGPMPSHLTGLLLEHASRMPNDAVMDYAFAVGLGPKFVGDSLEPFDLLDPGSGNDVSLNYRMVYRPGVLSPNQFGLLAAWNEINVDSGSSPELADLNQINQLTLGLFADWSRDKWRVLANFTYFNNAMRYIDGTQSDDFVAGYVQAEYQAAKDWIIFARSDNGFNVDKSPYLRLLSAFIEHRQMLGLRWDLANFQSLTLEVARNNTQGNDFSNHRFNEVRFQWSAVFP